MQEQRLATILWRGKWLILGAFLAGIVLSLVVTKTSSKIYAATAILRVNATPTGGTQTPTAEQQAAVQTLAATYATLVVDRSFLEQISSRVREIDGERLTAGQLRSHLTATAIKNTDLVQLRAEGGSPESAKALASDVINAFLIYIKQTSNQNLANLQDAIQAQIADLNRRIESLRLKAESSGAAAEQLNALTGARDALTTQLAQIVALGVQSGFNVTPAAPPTASKRPVQPRPLLNLVAGALLGLLSGFGLAYLRSRLDRGLHGSDEAEQLLNVPILASIPVRRRYSSDDPVLGEAYDVLRANLAFLSLDTPMQVLTFSSFNPREGKSSTVEGLAYAAVRGGMSVLMIDADVRTRTLSERLGHVDAPGLTNVIVGMATPEEATVELAPGLALMPSGPTPPNPPSLLSSGRMHDAIASLREQHSLILIDSPPVANLADAAILAAVSDGVVVVARVGVTERSHLPQAATNLRHSPTPIVGVVILEPRTVDQTYYPSMTRGSPVVTNAAASS